MTDQGPYKAHKGASERAYEQKQEYKEGEVGADSSELEEDKETEHKQVREHREITELNENKTLVSSWLYKRSQKTHQWQKRWVVLRNCQLSYYKSSSEYKASKVVNKSQLLSYSPILDSNKFHFAIYTNNRVLHWKCDDASTYNQWKSALEAFFQGRHRSLEDVRSSLSYSDSGFPAVVVPLASPERLQRCKFLKPLPKDAYCAYTDNDYEFLLAQSQLWRLHKRHQWKQYYVTLTNKKMYFYKSKRDIGNPCCTCPLDDLIDVIELDPLSKTKTNCLMIITPAERIRFCADNERDLSIWVSSLKAIRQSKLNSPVNQNLERCGVALTLSSLSVTL